MPRKTALRRTRTRTRTVAAASLIAAAALSLTACGSDGSDTDAKGNPSTVASPIHPDPNTSAIHPNDASADSPKGDTLTGDASDSSSSANRCTSDQLEAAWSDFEGGPDMEYDGQQTARVVLKNTGAKDCTMVGFPGVQLQTEHGETWDLRRTNDKPAPVTLDAGGRAAFDITFLASTRDDDRKFAPSQVVITPPNERRNIVLDWPYGGALLDQSGATHPGTYVGPVSEPQT
ncbi:DUF4232 domain-containing protein [Streptomyces sp. NPDC044780]|uniref:DUF4232 domain-containing protein n=1 Tax=unclassified Streptomyces TaxID=2593676 RepID=UPI0033FD4521